MQTTETAGSWVLPIAGLFVVAFAVGTAEIIVGGILPALASEFELPLPTIGWLVAAYAFGVAVFGPVIGVLTIRVRRKTLAIAMMGVFILGNALCATASSYLALMLSRVLVAGTQGALFGIAMVMATRIAPTERSASAISVVIAGFNAASVLGLPLGTAIGNAIGWRGSFWAITLLGAIGLAAITALVPHREVALAESSKLGTELRALAIPSIALAFLIIGLFLTADLVVYTYIVPIFEFATGFPVDYIPIVLGVAGIAGFAGNIAGGRLGDWNAPTTMVATVSILLAMYLLLPFVMHSPVPMIAVCIVWWFAGFAFVAPVQARILSEAKNAPNLASTLLSSAFCLGMALGATIGSLALGQGFDYSQLPLLSAAIAAPGLICAIVLSRRGR